MINYFILLKMRLVKLCSVWLMLAAVLSLTQARHHLDGATNSSNSSSLYMNSTYDSFMLGRIVNFVTFCFIKLFHYLKEHGNNVEGWSSVTNSKGI